MIIIRASGAGSGCWQTSSVVPAPPCARPSAGHWGPGGWVNQTALPAGALSLVVKTAKETVTVTEDEQGGQGHQTAPKLPGDSQGGCLEEGLRARP